MLDRHISLYYFTDMELRVLKYFLATTKIGTITGAANYLHLTQPTLSRQLMDLENELGQKLFIRSNHAITLTPEGLLLKKRAEEIIDMVEKTENEFNSLTQDLSGEIYIGSGETDAISCISDIIDEIHKQYPKIIFHLYSGILEDIVEKIDKGLLDFGIIMNPCDYTKYNSITLPEKDLWGIVMRKDSPLAKNNTVKLKDLEDKPLILSKKAFKGHNSDNFFYKWFNEKKDKLDIIATHNLFYNSSVLARQGIGYVFTLNNILNKDSDECLCFRPIEPKFEVKWDVIWKKYQVFSPAAKLFLDKLQEKFN